MSFVLILGAGSDIAKAVANKYASAGNNIILAGRNLDELKKNAEDLKVRYEVEAEAKLFDAVKFDTHNEFYNSLEPKPDIVITAFGYLGNNDNAKTEFSEAEKIIITNYLGAVSINNIIAEDFEKRQTGSIVGISSIAGERGRQSNYHYGSSKAGFTAYLSGLRNRFAKTNIHVLTVKPGFVYTKMTEGMPLPGALTAKPEKVANDIFKAQKKKKSVIYTKGIWRLIMFIIRHIPEFIFKKTNI